MAGEVAVEMGDVDVLVSEAADEAETESDESADSSGYGAWACDALSASSGSTLVIRCLCSHISLRPTLLINQ